MNKKQRALIAEVPQAMSTATFKARGKFDMASGEYPGTIRINRETGEVSARRKGCRTEYTLSLRQLADWICRTGLPCMIGAAYDEDE